MTAKGRFMAALIVLLARFATSGDRPSSPKPIQDI